MSILLYYFSDLVSQATYTVTVSTLNDLSSQIEEAGRYNVTASSILVTLPRRVTVPGLYSTTASITVPRGSSNNTAVAIGVSIVAHLVIMFVTIATTIVIALLAMR